MMEAIERRKRMKNFAQNFLYFGVCFVLAFCFFKTFFVGAALPPSIVTYQGKLLASGAPVTTTQQMYFLLYDAPVAGTALYSASGTVGVPNYISVTPSNGLFSLNFGDTGTNNLDASIFQNNDVVYLEVRIGAQTLSPRKRITASPFAINSKYLGGIEASTVSTSVYIPISDSSGNFTFNFVTTTGLAVNGDSLFFGNVTSTGYIAASSSFRSSQYCDINGQNCFDPSASGWGTAATELTTTIWTTDGNITSTGTVGYKAATARCNYEFPGYHFCFSGEIIQIIASQDISYFTGNAWIAEGPPGYTANSNDCSGYTSSANNYLGAFWAYDSNGGGMGWLTACSGVKPLSCCK
ncbi:hypothetical protein KKA13_02465 [Patescibacteria group bacterium]|nr:hypothetical protein [Patescibacteria group bacterium]